MKKCLVIEDDSLQREFIKRRLSQYAEEVITAKNGTEGLQMAAKYLPELIVCDYYLPDLEAIELIKRIKTNKDLERVPILLVSSWLQEDTLEAVKAAGAVGYLQKPIHQDQLSLIIGELFVVAHELSCGKLPDRMLPAPVLDPEIL